VSLSPTTRLDAVRGILARGRLSVPVFSALLIAVMMTASVALHDVFGAFDLALFDLTTRIAARWRHPSGNMVLLSFGDYDLANLGHRWPLPRALLADFIDRVNAAQPRLIILDILFQQPAADSSDGDRRLAAAMKAGGNVGLISVTEEITSARGVAAQTYRSIPALRNVAALEGFVWGDVDADGKIRSFRFRDELTDDPGIALAVARHLADAAGDSAALAPVGASRSFLRWARANGGIDRISAWDLWTGRIASAALCGKTIIVCNTSPVQGDYHDTSLGRLAGGEILATAIDTLRLRRAVCPLAGWHWPFVLLVVGAALGVLQFSFLSSRVFPKGLAICLVAGVGAFAAAAAGHVFLPCSYLLFGAILFLGAFSVLDSLAEFVRFQEDRSNAQAAGRIQESFFPTAPLTIGDDYICEGFCKTCEEAGGDFFDYFRTHDGKLFVCTLDVAGHGFAAAMITTIIKTTIDAWRRRTMDLVGLFKALNGSLFFLLRRRRMVTAIALALDPETHRVSLCAAGHPAPFHKTPVGVQDLGLSSFPLGVLPSARYRFPTPEFNMGPGDILMFYSDGVVEAVNGNSEQFGYERISRALQELPDHCEPREINDHLMRRVREFCGHSAFEDDVTVVTLKRRRFSELRSV